MGILPVARISQNLPDGRADGRRRPVVRPDHPTEAKPAHRWAFSGWSAAIGMTTTGSPCPTAANTVLCPPWVTTRSQCGRSRLWDVALDVHVGRLRSQLRRVLAPPDGDDERAGLVPQPLEHRLEERGEDTEEGNVG